MMRLTFVESTWFTERLKRRLDDDGYRALQDELQSNPEKGATMPGGGGLRKIRFGIPAVEKESEVA